MFSELGHQACEVRIQLSLLFSRHIDTRSCTRSSRQGSCFYNIKCEINVHHNGIFLGSVVKEKLVKGLQPHTLIQNPGRRTEQRARGETRLLALPAAAWILFSDDPEKENVLRDKSGYLFSKHHSAGSWREGGTAG